MKAEDLRAKTVDELNDEIDSLAKEAFNLRFQRQWPIRKYRPSEGRTPGYGAVKTILNQKAQDTFPKEFMLEMPKRIMQGVVVSDKMDKTVVVNVERNSAPTVQEIYQAVSAIT